MAIPQTELPDDHLVDLARSGDTDAIDVLLRRYTSYARSKAKTYFLIGADREDIIQEGMIGLFKAIRDFDASKTVSFRTFAELCITRQIITAIKVATRQKHAPLNSYVSLHRSVVSEEDGERQLADFLASARVIDPVEMVVAEDEVQQIRAFLSDILSQFEVEVLNMYLQGRSYHEIAASLRRQTKSIDNALQRIKRKLDTFLRQREQEAEDESREPRTVVHVSRFGAVEGFGDGAIRSASPSVLRQNGSAATVTGNGHNGNGNGNGHTGNGNGNGHTGTVRPLHVNGNAKAKTVSSSGPGDLRAGLRYAVAAATHKHPEAKGKPTRRSG